MRIYRTVISQKWKQINENIKDCQIKVETDQGEYIGLLDRRENRSRRINRTVIRQKWKQIKRNKQDCYQIEVETDL